MSFPTVTDQNVSAIDIAEIDLSSSSNIKLGDDAIGNSLANKDNAEIEDKQQSGKCYTSLLSFSIFFGFGAMLSYAANYYLSSQITTLEKVFKLSSSKSGILLSAGDVGFLITVMFSAHFLQRYHIPRILSVSLLIVGTFSVLAALPKLFVSDAPAEGIPSMSNSTEDSPVSLCVLYNKSQQSAGMGPACQSETTNDDDKSGTSDSSIWFLVLMGLALLIVGAADSPKQTLQTIYVDNTTERSKAGFYIGILLTFGIFGPFCAMFIGGLFNKLPTDLKETSLSTTDPRWIGAWWLGFVVFGGSCILCSIFLFCFPRGKNLHSEQNKNDQEMQNQTCLRIAKDIPRSILRIMMDPVFTLMCINGMTTSLGNSAVISFGPKYMETQFFLPTWKADLILGGRNLFTSTVGTLLGGMLSRRMRFGRTGCLKLVILTRLAQTIVAGFNYFLGCDHSHMFGLDTSRGGNDTFPCDCSNVGYLPVCLDGRKTYFSPCHAGCQVNVGERFTNCSLSENGQATPGICDNSCDFLIPFIVTTSLESVITSLGMAPSIIIIISSVRDRDRTIAMGLISFIAVLINLPANLIYGKMFDSICLIWHTSCGKEGACLFYDSQAMRTRLISADFGLKFLALLILCVALIFSLRKDKTVDTYEMKEDVSKQIEVTELTKLTQRL